jgi:hypothetical protein
MLPLRQLRCSITGVPPRQAQFDPRSGHVEFVVDKVALGANFLGVLQFSLPIIIPPTTPYSVIILLLTLFSLNTDNIVK